MSGSIRARWVALAIGGLFAAAVAVALGLGVANGNLQNPAEGGPLILSFSAFAAVGALIVSRHPRHRIGWLFSGIGLVAGIGWGAQEYAHYALLTEPGSLPGVAWAAWLAGWWWYPMLFGVLLFTPLLFPTGRPPSPRWRPVLWVAVSGGLAVTVLAMLNPTYELHDARRVVVRTPLGVEAVGNIEETTIGGLLFALLGATLLAAVTSVVVRYRRSRGEERQQLKWFAFAAALLVVVPLGDMLPPGLQVAGNIAFGVILAFLPISAGIAILRYRLYDIDVVINKTLVYGALAGFITAVYVGVVVGIGAAIGAGDEPNVALSIAATAMVAVAFQPVRERIQRLANRLVYGRRASPYETLAGFSERVAGTYAAEDVLPRMARVLAEGTGARHASVWLRVGDELRRSARWPADEGGDEPLPLGGDEVPPVPGADITLAVRHRGEVLGALAVAKGPGEPLRPQEEALLGDLASQAGLVLRNVRLTEELRARVRDVSRLAGRLQESRRRIVATQDAERRRIERDIHDGAQQHLVALAVHLKLARTTAAGDVEKARPLVSGLVRAADDALGELRDLARGIYPPLLEAEGIAAAVRAQAEKAPVRVEVDAESLRRHPQEVEAAAYFCVLEALQNVGKYADATVARVRLRDEGGALRFDVRDDGKGFDPGTTAWGSGLTNMADRVAALGGTVAVDSAPGTGTTVSGTIPVRDREPVG